MCLIRAQVASPAEEPRWRQGPSSLPRALPVGDTLPVLCSAMLPGAYVPGAGRGEDGSARVAPPEPSNSPLVGGVAEWLKATDSKSVGDSGLETVRPRGFESHRLRHSPPLLFPRGGTGRRARLGIGPPSRPTFPRRKPARNAGSNPAGGTIRRVSLLPLRFPRESAHLANSRPESSFAQRGYRFFVTPCKRLQILGAFPRA
jgi:hypothetical protein